MELNKSSAAATGANAESLFCYEVSAIILQQVVNLLRCRVCVVAFDINLFADEEETFDGNQSQPTTILLRFYLVSASLEERCANKSRNNFYRAPGFQ